jgi:hypothetical protein
VRAPSSVIFDVVATRISRPLPGPPTSAARWAASARTQACADRGAAVAVERPGAGGGGHRARGGGHDLGVHGAPLAGSRRAQAWQHRSWIYPRDPDFAAKVARALVLYTGHWDGEPLVDNDFVICG